MYEVQCTRQGEKYVAGKGVMQFHPHISMEVEFNARWGETGPHCVFLRVEVAAKKSFPQEKDMIRFFHSLGLAALLENRTITHHNSLNGNGFELIYNLPIEDWDLKNILRIIRKDIGHIQQKLSEHMKEFHLLH